MIKRSVAAISILLFNQSFASDDFYFVESEHHKSLGYPYFCKQMSDDNCDDFFGTLDYNTYKGTKGTIISEAIIDDYHTNNKVFYKVRLFDGKEYYHLVEEDNEKRIAKFGGLILAEDKKKMTDLKGKEVVENSGIYYKEIESNGSDLIYTFSNNNRVYQTGLDLMKSSIVYFNNKDLNKTLVSLDYQKISKYSTVVKSKDLEDSPVSIYCSIGSKNLDFCMMDFNISSGMFLKPKSASLKSGYKQFGYDKDFKYSSYISGAVFESLSFEIKREDLKQIEDIVNSEKPYVLFSTKYNSIDSKISIREVRGLKRMLEVAKNVLK